MNDMTSNHRPENEILLEHVAQDWLESNPRVRSRETVRLMLSTLRRFEEYLKRPASVGDFTERNVSAFLKHRTFEGKALCTVEREGSKLLTLWRWAAKRGWCNEPLMTIRKAPPPTPTAWTRSEMKALMKAADAHETEFNFTVDGEKYKLPGNLVMGALLRVLLDTGERINATMRITWADVDLPNRLITFRAAYRKNGDKDNIQRISRTTRRALTTMQQWYGVRGAQPGPLVFPENDKGRYYYHLKLIFKASGVPVGPRAGFHQVRKTHATALYIMGGDPTASLGHGDSKMTRDWYLDPRQTRKDYAADVMAGGVTMLVKRCWRRTKAAFGLW